MSIVWIILWLILVWSHFLLYAFFILNLFVLLRNKLLWHYVSKHKKQTAKRYGGNGDKNWKLAIKLWLSRHHVNVGSIPKCKYTWKSCCYIVLNYIKFTMNLPSRYENFGIEQYLMSHHLEVQYANMSPKKVIMTPNGNTAA